MLGRQDVERAIPQTDLAAVGDRLESFVRENGHELLAGRPARSSRGRTAKARPRRLRGRSESGTAISRHSADLGAGSLIGLPVQPFGKDFGGHPISPGR